MILPTVMFYFGIVHLVLDILRMAGFKAPFRISSTPKGSVMPTALYALIEDVVAVDGGGGQIYRYALRTRYLSSPYFRRMLFEMNCFWSGGSIICATAITIIIFTVSEPVAYTVRSIFIPTIQLHTDVTSWAGPSLLHGQVYGPSLPFPGSRAISAAKRKPGLRTEDRAVFPGQTISLRRRLEPASLLYRNVYRISCLG